MLVLDTEAIEKNKKRLLEDQQHDQTSQWCQDQLQHCCYVENKAISVANEERQTGRPLGYNVFKQEIEKLSPRLKVEHHPFQDQMAWVYTLEKAPSWDFDPTTGIFGGIRKSYISAVRFPIIPEWSLMQMKIVKVPESMDRNKVGMVWRKKPGREEIRGWRTVLVYLVLGGFITGEQARRFSAKYGSEDRETWWRYMEGQKAIF